MSDQYGKKISNTETQGKLVLILGCHYTDIVLCRKHGRKIYWQLQNKPELSGNKIKYIPYILLTRNLDVIENYIRTVIHEKYESIYLDRQGQMISGLKNGQSFLRIYNRKGNLVFQNYFLEVKNEDTEKIYRILKELEK